MLLFQLRVEHVIDHTASLTKPHTAAQSATKDMPKDPTSALKTKGMVAYISRGRSQEGHLANAFHSAHQLTMTTPSIGFGLGWNIAHLTIYKCARMVLASCSMTATTQIN